MNINTVNYLDSCSLWTEDHQRQCLLGHWECVLLGLRAESRDQKYVFHHFKAWFSVKWRMEIFCLIKCSLQERTLIYSCISAEMYPPGRLHPHVQCQWLPSASFDLGCQFSSKFQWLYCFPSSELSVFLFLTSRKKTGKFALHTWNIQKIMSIYF